MGDAYTPGLTVTGSAIVRKSRRLPLTGDVVVKVGDRVEADRVVARTELPGKVNLINFSNVLGVLPDEIEGKLLVKPGDDIKQGELLAESRSFFGLFRSIVESPIDGTLESVSKITGQAVLREVPTPVEVKAYINGVVVEEIENEGVVVESHASMVQGIFGLSGEVNAVLEVVVDSPDEPLKASTITKEHKGKILIGGAHATLAAMRKAIELEVAGIVVGGFAYQDISELLGYDVGVAVTGTEALGTTLVVTEGFGEIAMARATFELLSGHSGDLASITGATQIRAGVIRPEVIIPHETRADDHDIEHLGLDVGAPVRCIRAPYFGRIGTISALPVELKKMASETMVRVCTVQLEKGDEVVIPRANVEVIER
jgi:hypothetical protein